MEKYNPIRVNHKDDVGVQVRSKVREWLRKKEGIGAWIKFNRPGYFVLNILNVSFEV